MNDLRLALRNLRRKPGFTTAAVVTVALGIGVNAAVFGLANWIMLRPVPGVRDAGRVVVIEFRDSRGSPAGTSYPNLADLRAQSPALSDLAGWVWSPVAVRTEQMSAQYLQAGFVSADYFCVLGATFLGGRRFSQDDEVAAPNVPVAVISERLWAMGFARDPAAVGRFITVNGFQTLVIGVAPAGFRGTDLLAEFDLWVPATAYGILRRGGTMDLHDRGAQLLIQLVGRLAPGATVAQAEAQLQAAAVNIAANYPDVHQRWKASRPVVFPGIGVPVRARDTVRRAVLLLSGVAGLVLLIACANVANLFLFRGVVRRDELALRQALGASPGRVAWAQLTECLVVSVAAGALAVLLATWITAGIRGPLVPDLPEIGQVQLDWRVLGFAGAVALVTGIVFGLAPALAAFRSDVTSGLQGAGKRVSRGSGGLRATFATLQVSLSLSVLVMALLLVGTLRNLRRIDVGFDADRVTSFTIGPGEAGGYTREQSRALLQEALARIRAIPGVEEVSLSAYSPFTFSFGDRVRTADASDSSTGVTLAYVSPSYFRTMGTSLVAGRGFTENEVFVPFVTAEGVAIITRTLARRLFGDTDPIGRTFTNNEPTKSHRVVGVVEDSRWATLADEGAGPIVYEPLTVLSANALVLLVRSPLPVSDLRSVVQQAMGPLAPSVPLYDVARLRDKIERKISQERLLARTLTSFAALAVVLAAIGLYAVVAFSVAERTRELGIRMALGARAEQVLRMVMAQGARIAGVGVLLGLGGAAGLSRLVASRLYGLSALEPRTYGLATVLLLALAIGASIIPARRATRVDPMIALRAE